MILVLLMLFLSTPLLAAEMKASLVEYRKVMDLTGTAESEMVMPTDVAIGKGQRVYVVDSGNHRVLAYAADGSFLFAFGSKGSGAGQLDSPVGIAASRDGRVLVADRGNRRVQIFDSDGAFLKTITTILGDAEVVPVDVAVDQAEKRIFVSGSAPYHRLLIFDNSGKAIGIWGKPGNNFGEFRYPAALAVSKDDETYIVDVFNTRVQVLNDKGEYLVTVGSWGVTPGHLFRPKGVAIENDDQILVSDSYLGVIQIYNSDTRFHAVLGTNGEIARFDTPAGMTVDKRDRLYVAEMLANKVSVFQPVQAQ
ncbi:MAG: NHL repeat-containing protein [Candidatus Thiodiazotropha sp. (ex Epidulcina cf. delphinae)]|nr:NHL repeat-containing protein [Candidatus Thiodiazotropha sp. (ex Epidulcina cf. delphinae)]